MLRRPGAEQVTVFEVMAWDRNCPQHIPQKFDADAVLAAVHERDREVYSLKTEIARLREAELR